MEISGSPESRAGSSAGVGLVRRLRPNFVSYQFHNHIGESGVRRIRRHDLRHTHAMWLPDAGEHLYVGAECVGHIDPRTTADVRANVRDGDGQLSK